MCVSVCAGVKGTFCHVLLVFGWARGSVRVYLSLDLYSLSLSRRLQTIFVYVNTWFVVLCVCISPSLGLFSQNNLHIKLIFTEDIIIYLSLSLRMHSVSTHTYTRAREKKHLLMVPIGLIPARIGNRLVYIRRPLVNCHPLMFELQGT